MQQFPQIQIRDIKAFAVWKWQAQELENSSCPICRIQFIYRCMECENLYVQDNENRECKMAQGMCGHIFHAHCIEKWIKTKSNGANQGLCGQCPQVWDISNQILLDR
ncbi:RING-box protein 2 [Paramecium bursaria]